jgi:ABC-type multidrug transport system ATPase subunit
MAVLISSHILHEVEQVCDKVVIINRGRLVAQGKTEELRRELLPNSVFNLVSNNSLRQLSQICGEIDGEIKVEIKESLSDGWNRYRLSHSNSIELPRKLSLPFN